MVPCDPSPTLGLKLFPWGSLKTSYFSEAEGTGTLENQLFTPSKECDISLFLIQHSRTGLLPELQLHLVSIPQLTLGGTVSARIAILPGPNVGSKSSSSFYYMPVSGLDTS